jgi:hypothetical protein
VRVREFLLKASIFALPFAVVLFVCERHLPLPSTLAGKRELLRRATDAQVIVTGSSHAYFGVATPFLGPPALNLANNDQDIFYDTRIATICAQHLHSLRLVILSVSYFALDYRLADSVESWRCFGYHQAFGLPLEPGLSDWDPRAWSRIALLGNTESFHLLVQGFPAPPPEGTLAGWLLQPAVSLPRPGLLRDAKAAAGRHNAAMTGRHTEANLSDLRSLFALLAELHVKTVLVTLPVTRAYATEIDPASYARFKRTLGELSSETGVPYVNYMDAPGFDDSDFKDADHLHALGARKFTLRFASEVVAPLLR